MKMKLTEQYCDEIKESGLPTFIWGAQGMAELVYARLAVQDIEVDGFVVDDEYMSEGARNVIARSFLMKNYEEYNIICGYTELFYRSQQDIEDHWKGCKKIYFFPDVYDIKATEPITEEFYKEREKEFSAVRNVLFDEFSKQSFNAFLDEKVSGDYRLILPYVVEPQYFFRDAPWNYSRDEVLFDCGAYDGDSIQDFIDIVGDYKRIIACEPDRNNYKRLLDNIERNGWRAVEPYLSGVSDVKRTFMFQASGDMYSQISEEGNEKIDVDTIDNISKGEEISIIKMDIEGFEMEALRGAENTIRRYRPMLMISAYHKRDDIYNIYQFINSIAEDYSYFFRCHKTHPIDAVLYWIPNERLK